MISRLTSLGFGVAVMYETVALGNSRLNVLQQLKQYAICDIGRQFEALGQLFLANFGKEGVPETVVPQDQSDPRRDGRNISTEGSAFFLSYNKSSKL
jgi:hypothetical protein